jgi:hypothetical protein
MALTFKSESWWAKDYTVLWAARPRSPRVLIRIIDLPLSPYVAGGWTLTVADHPGMRFALGGFQIADTLPNSKKITPAGVQAVFVTDPASRETKLQLWINGAEAVAGWTGPAGSELAVGIAGS